MEDISPTLSMRVVLSVVEQRGAKTHLESGRYALLVSPPRFLVSPCILGGELQKVGSGYESHPWIFSLIVIQEWPRVS